MDPVTPLMTQWTYQSMLHQLIGIENNIVPIDGKPDAILSMELDDFYEENMYTDFGTLGDKGKTLVAAFASMYNNVDKLTTEQALKMLGSADKIFAFGKKVELHMGLITKISNLQESRHLMDVSEAEQITICGGCPKTSLNMIGQLWGLMTDEDKYRLVLLYALKHGKDAKSETKNLISKIAKTESQKAAIELIIEWLGFAMHPCATMTTLVDQLPPSDTENQKHERVDCIFMVHKPVLWHILQGLITNKLSDCMYPFATSYENKNGYVVRFCVPENLNMLFRPKKILVFIVGGITCAEAAVVHSINVQFQGKINVILGGPNLINTER